MTSQRVRGLILAASVTGMLTVSFGATNAFASTHHVVPDRSIITISWTGPDVSEAACQAATAYEKKWSNTLAASCDYEATDPQTDVGGPGWYNYLAVENIDE